MLCYSIFGDFMNIGIICEYNPFHYGHIYHINKVKEMYPTSNIVLVLSGNICQRGDLSLINKFDKADVALKYGIDLVVELPFKFIQSADYFAKGSIEILNKLKCRKIVFGSESNDIDLLTTLAKTQINNKEFDKKIKKELSSGINYPTALSKALKELTGKEVNAPNDILGITYIKEIIKNKYNIEPICIKRTTDYNNKKIEGKITSASSIKELIKNNKNFKIYIPKYSHKYFNNPIFLDDYFDYLKYQIIISNDLTIYQDIDTNLSNRIKKYIVSSNNLNELINNIKTKKFTYNKIKRVLTHILFNIKNEDCNNKLDYIRILAFNKKGKSVLNKIKKEIDIPILTKYDNKYLNKDLEITKILSLNPNIKNKEKYIQREYKQKPII